MFHGRMSRELVWLLGGFVVLFIASACGACSEEPRRHPARLMFQDLEFEGEPSQLTTFRFIPGTSEFLALSRDGWVRHYELQADRAVLHGLVRLDEVHTEGDCGLISLAFDPNFANNRIIYLGMCFSMTESGIRRYTFDRNDITSLPATGIPVMRVGEPNAIEPWHNIGAMGFDATGALWALYGDKTVSANGQDTTTDLGTMVRILPRLGAGESGFDPAPDNPFIADPNQSPNIYAYGLRSPWTGTYDHMGRWWIGDVGSSLYEEINLVTRPAMNFGWAELEGPCDDCEGTTPPLRHWTHDIKDAYVLADPDAEPVRDRVGWIGPEYRPGQTDRYDGLLSNRLLFGDMCAGFVRGVEIDRAGNVLFDEHLGHLANVTGWDIAPDGYIYAVTFAQRCTTDPGPEFGASRLVRVQPVSSTFVRHEDR